MKIKRAFYKLFNIGDKKQGVEEQYLLTFIEYKKGLFGSGGCTCEPRGISIPGDSVHSGAYTHVTAKEKDGKKITHWDIGILIPRDTEKLQDLLEVGVPLEIRLEDSSEDKFLENVQFTPGGKPSKEIEKIILNIVSTYLPVDASRYREMHSNLSTGFSFESIDDS
jgi:hypothetical protein